MEQAAQPPTTRSPTEHAAPRADAQPPQASQEAALGSRVGSGMFWLFALTVFAKALTFLAQIVLGWKLSDADFGVFALATAVAGFLMVCREAGMRELIVQRGLDEYDALAGPTFWLAFWYNMLVGTIIACLAWWIAGIADATMLVPVLLIIGVSLPIGTASGMLLNKMRIHMQFKAFATRMAISHTTRQLSSIAFAFANYGVMALAWPILISSLVETWLSWAMTKDSLWDRPARPSLWSKFLSQSKWIMFASIANFAVDWGPFLLLVPLGLSTKAVSGQFYWAFNITAQVGILLGWNLMAVLTPALQRLNDEPERQAAAVLRSLRSLMLIGCIASLGVAAIFLPLEQLLWKGKWAVCGSAVVILGAFFPWRITFGVTASLLQAQGRFKRYALLTLVEGIGFTLAVLAGALWSKDEQTSSAVMSLYGGVWLLVSRLTLTIWMLTKIGIAPIAILSAMIPAWLVSLLAGAAGILAGIASRSTVGEVVDRIVPELYRHYALNGALVCICGTACALTFGIIARFWMKSHVVEALAVCPARLRTPLSSLLLLRENAPGITAGGTSR